MRGALRLSRRTGVRRPCGGLAERVVKIEHKLGAGCGAPPNPERMAVAVLSDLLEAVPVTLRWACATARHLIGDHLLHPGRN